MIPCPQLLKSQKEPNEPAKGRRPADGVDLHRFSGLHPQGRTLILDFAERAISERQCTDDKCFEPFIFGWMAVNGWSTCVTGEASDAAYIRALIKDEDFDRRFTERINARDECRRVVQKFQSLWPIFRSQDVRSIPEPSGTRKEVVREYRRTVQKARYSPACYFQHQRDGSEILADWPHTISAIYQVRCNLFHGFKGLHSENDVAIVSAAFRVLIHVIQMLKLAGSEDFAQAELQLKP